MPEGHTVHRLAHAFQAHFVGKAVEASSPQGRFADGAALLDGRYLLAAEAQGKQMFLHFSGDLWLRVHLGLYGMWRFAGEGLEQVGRRQPKGAHTGTALPEPRGAVRLRLIAGRHAADLSGPTACEVIGPAEKDCAQARLGEDPLRDDAVSAKAFAKIHASRTAIAALLMRQDIVAGVGNIYRAELLFRARLDPHDAGRTLTKRAWTRIWNDLVQLMREGVQTGGIVTTEPRHRKSRRAIPPRDHALYVAHRAGRPCHVCGHPVLAEAMAGRTLYWCSTCQIK